MRIPRLKMRRALMLIAVGASWFWLMTINPGVLIGGTIVLALLLVAIFNRDRVIVARESEAGRARRLSRVGIVGYSLAIALAFLWLASIWFWQVVNHETDKLYQPTLRAKP